MSATLGWAAAVSSSAQGSAIASMTSPAATTAVSHPAKPPDRCRDDRMQHRELHEPAGPQHPGHLLERALGIGDIHQAHERGHGIKRRGAEWQGGTVAGQIADPRAVLSGRRGEERLGDIQRDHASTFPG